MGIIGNVLTVGAKVMGTVVVGGTGVVLASIEDGLKSTMNNHGNELRSAGKNDVVNSAFGSTSSLSDACFKTVKKMWGGNVEKSDIMNDLTNAAVPIISLKNNQDALDTLENQEQDIESIDIDNF